MRAKDLKTDGTVYYYTTQDTWLRWTHSPERVTVLDSRVGHWNYDRCTEEWVWRKGGQTVLVEVAAKGGNAARRMAVRTVTLRGVWDDCAQQVEQARRERQQDYAASRASADAIELECLRAATALNTLGIDAQVPSPSATHGEIRVPHKHAALLAAAAQHLIDTGWTAPSAD